MHVQIIPPAETQASGNQPLRVKDIAEALRPLRVTKAIIYAEIKSGRLAHYRVGTGRGTIRVSRAAFTQYLAERGIPAAELAVTL
jgi:excisionase family DNA binding protein